MFSITETDVPHLAQQEDVSGSLNREHRQCILSALFEGVWQCTVFRRSISRRGPGKALQIVKEHFKGEILVGDAREGVLHNHLTHLPTQLTA